MPVGHMIGKGGGNSRPSFQLFDPRKNFKRLRHRKFARMEPRIHFFEYDPRVAALWPAPKPVVEPPPPPDGLVNAQRLSRRLQALKSALEDLPRQARRLARWQAEAEGRARPQVPVAAAARPSAGLPPEAHSRGR